MAISKTKVAIVGCGNVGTTLSYYLVSNHICDRLLLINRTKSRAWAEAEDLKHSLGFSNIKMEIKSGEYSDCGDADVVVLTQAAVYKEGMTRLDMYKEARKIMDQTIPAIMDSGFQGIFLVVTNPVDLISQYVQQLSQLPPQRVFGTGTSLDSARLRVYLANLMDVDERSVLAMCMGEHGDSQIIPWSTVTIGGKPFLDILEDNPQRLKEVDLSQIQSEISQVAYDIVRGKKATYYGIASVTGQIVNAILNDEEKVMPVSCMLRGEYGLNGVYAGLPAVIYRNGIKESVTYHLTDEELRAFKNSVNILREAASSEA